MIAKESRFPFGAPIEPRGVEVPGRSFAVVVIGAYPSAFHVRWTPPNGFGPAVAALPVDNEPTPFWDGNREEVQALFIRWSREWFSPRWGTATPARLNGPSGRDLEARWLRPLGYDRDSAFITDCLTTARASTGVMRRLEDRYKPVVAALNAPPTELRPHPSERDIVVEALSDHSDRLRLQIERAAPALIITLGNAAARVLAGISSYSGRPELVSGEYAHERHIEVADRTYRWRALIHPAAPDVWQRRHQRWVEGASYS